MNATTLLVFCAVALVAIVTPGPTVLLALANGSRFGVRRSQGGLQLPQEGGDARARAGRSSCASFLVAVTNPKGYLFCTALLPQFIDASRPRRPNTL